MRSQRGDWLGSWVLAAIFVVAPAVSTTVHAQPGFGPDPFWPYNNQYTPYTTPMGPASPDAGQGSPTVGRPGFAGANQFQSYLDGLSGPGRNASDRSTVGVPGYLSAVAPTFDRRRDYVPNAKTTARFEDNQREVTEKYFAYFSERDPKKRAELLKAYQRARRQSTRSLSPRSQSPSRVLDAASRDTADALAGPMSLPRTTGGANRSRSLLRRNPTNTPGEPTARVDHRLPRSHTPEGVARATIPAASSSALAGWRIAPIAFPDRPLARPAALGSLHRLRVLQRRRAQTIEHGPPRGRRLRLSGCSPDKKGKGSLDFVIPSGAI